MGVKGEPFALRVIAHAASIALLCAGAGWAAARPAQAGAVGDRPALSQGGIAPAAMRLAADMTPPTKPDVATSRVSGLAGVEVSWTPATDVETGVARYLVYRYQYAGAAPVFVTQVAAPALSVIVPENGDASRKYLQYYAVRAEDGAGNLSEYSTACAPDPHGASVVGMNAYNCMLCHEAHEASHMALGALSAAACYDCHGRTNAADPPDTAAYGDGSTLDTQASFGDDVVIASGGADLPGGRTVHRTAAMVASQSECVGCHTPHRRPYAEGPGGYDPTGSYSFLLRGNQIKTGAPYSTDAAPFGNAYCFGCHGSGVSAYMNDAGGAQAFDTAGGDHETGFSASAHSETTVLNTIGAVGKLQANCTACHNEHGSPNNGLADYRQSNTAAATYNQSGLCYACHSASSSETRSVGSAPFSWNGQDVSAEFQKASRHPTNVPYGAPSAQSGIWTQTTQADFSSDTLVDAVATAGGSVELATVGGAPPTVFSDGFESNDFSNWDADPPYWATTSADKNGGTYSARGYATSTTRRTDYLVKTIDVSGRTNVRLDYAFKVVGLAGGTDYFRVEYYSAGAWTQLYNTTANVTSWTTRSDTIPASATQVRFTSSVNWTTEFCYVDDVSVAADAIPYTYVNVGTATAGAISVSGTLEGWTELRFGGAEPVGSSLRVDVLDGADEEVLLSDLSPSMSPVPLSIIDRFAHPTLKLRARLVGDAPIAPSLSDAFGDGTFDTATWTDAFLGGSTDPDAGSQTVVWNGDMENWGSLTGVGRFDVADTPWTLRTGQNDGAVASSNEYARARQTNAANRYLQKNAVDLSAYSSAIVEFYDVTTNFNGGDELRVEWFDGTGWSTLRSITANEGTRSNGNWYFNSITVPGGSLSANNGLRFVYTSNDTNCEMYVDEVRITGVAAPTNDWPREAGGQLTLRAEGAGFGGTSDEGEYVYSDPAAAPWIAGADFDLKVSVRALANLAGAERAGLQIRTGTTEANAIAAGAKMAGIYLTPTGVRFQYRTTAGGAAAGPAEVAGAAPEWLLLQRRGNTITAKHSEDGATWTTVGSQSVTLDGSVLVGLALTSSTNGTFDEASFDDFLVSGVTAASTMTPTLDEWTVEYSHIPPELVGQLTCVSCHNVHLAQKGAPATAWQMSRVSDPDNVKSAAPGTVTEFCRRCHDGAAPTRTLTSTVFVPYTLVFTDQSASPFFPGWNKWQAGLEFTAGGHGASAVQNMTPGCESCHDPHGSDNERLTAATAFYTGGSPPAGHVDERRNNTSAYAEENLCYVCHTNDRTPNCSAAGCHTSSLDRINVQTAFSQTYRHPLSTSGRHSDTEGAADLGASNRHAECADCHDVHSATSSRHTAGSSLAGGVLRGATGVKPTWGSSNWTVATDYATERMNGQSTDYEAYVCLKCHSGYSGQPFSVTTASGTYTSTDLALEFNPANQSGHNVMGQVWPKTTTAQGLPYSFGFPSSNTFAAGWNSTSPVTCSDCHTYSAAGARGPHGSSVPFLIDSAYAGRYTTAYLNTGSSSGMTATGGTAMCAKCHDLYNSGWGNSAHSEGHHQGSSDGLCVNCHIRIPHGWKRPRLLGYDTDPAPYKTNNGTLNAISYEAHTPNGWQQDGDCMVDSCYDPNHGSAFSNIWP